MTSKNVGVRDRGRVKSDIDVTALVAVLLLLLSIMLISVPSLRAGLIGNVSLIVEKGAPLAGRAPD